MRPIVVVPAAAFAVVAPVAVLFTVTGAMAGVRRRRIPIQASADLAAEAQGGGDARPRLCTRQPTVAAFIAVVGVAVLRRRHGRRQVVHETIVGGEPIDALAVLT